MCVVGITCISGCVDIDVIVFRYVMFICVVFDVCVCCRHCY